MSKNTRLLTFGLVFLLSGLFFWMIFNNYLFPSQADESNKMQVLFKDKTIECNRNGVCLAYIFASVGEQQKLVGIQGEVTFTPDSLEVIGMAKDQFCSSASFELDSVFDFRVDSTTGKATFALSTVKPNDQLHGGTRCVTALVLKPKAGANVDQAKLALTANSWKAGGISSAGQKLVYAVDADQTPTQVTINQTAPIPTITITPPGSAIVTGMPGTTGTPSGTPPGSPSGAPQQPPVIPACETGPKGDCNCDTNINFADWEVIRKGLNGEGQACDVNGDGKSDKGDITIWIRNFLF